MLHDLTRADANIQSSSQSETAIERLGRVGDAEIESTAAIHYEVCKNNLLWRMNEDGKVRLCIPSSCRGHILKIIHDELVHPGTAQCWEFAQKHYFWPTIWKDIKQYCRCCRFCQLVKTDTSKKPGLLRPVETPLPLHTLCIDFVEGLPASRGCDSLATVTEKFTKVVALIPCKKSTSAMEFAKLFFGKIYPMWGVPEKIISDRDRRFTSTFWRTLFPSDCARDC